MWNIKTLEKWRKSLILRVGQEFLDLTSKARSMKGKSYKLVPIKALKHLLWKRPCKEDEKTNARFGKYFQSHIQKRTHLNI
jgi:hypothetical protein